MLDEFCLRHADSRKPLLSWIQKVTEASWHSKFHVLNSFPKAKMLGDNRVRFEIVHNTYRLIVRINYEKQLVLVKFIGTHNEYDKIDPFTI